MLSLKDKVVFISGAGSVGDDPDAKIWGNGKATAVLLARQGGKIYGVDVRKQAADVTKAIIEREGGTCRTPCRRHDQGEGGRGGGRRLYGRVWAYRRAH